MKKAIIYIMAIILVAALGVVIGRSINSSTSSNKVYSNSIDNKTKEQIKNEVKNREENKISNSTTNNVIEQPENNVDDKKEEEQKTDAEKAMDMVKADWGEDDGTVYFDEAEKTDDGEYIICVREKETTNAKAWYKVNIENETAERWD